MGTSVQTEPVIRFQDFQVNLDTGELWKAGVRLKLQDQPFKVLATLVQRPGQVVTREDLRKLIWPQESFGDFDHAINLAIAKLRATLGDSADVPHLIETLPRRGYRFIGSVVSHAVPPGAVPTRDRSVFSLFRFRPRVIVVAAVLLTILGIVLVFNLDGLRDRILRSTVAVPKIKSIAILPLENLSHDEDQEYFADGMTEELTTSLAQITALRVVSRTSVMRYKGSLEPLPQIARELNVDAIIEGSVLQSANHVRINVQLIPASTDKHLWAESYDRDLRDVLTLQREVATAIIAQVQAKLTPQDQSHLVKMRQVNPDAYQAYLKALYFGAKWTRAGENKCIEYSQQAIELDPTYAPPFASMAGCYSMSALYGYESPTDGFLKAKAAASKALELDDRLAEAHANLGWILLAHDWDWSGAEKEMQRALLLNPNSSSAHASYSFYLMVIGRSEESVREAKRTLELDPLTPTTNVGLGFVLYYARRHDESIVQLKKALELDSGISPAHAELGWNYAQKHMYPEAVNECQQAVSLAPNDQAILAGCGRVYGLAGRREYALALADRLNRSQVYLDPYNMAWLRDGLRDNDVTIVWLERGYREHSPGMIGLRVETWTEGLRLNPRFQALLRKMDFP